jgi:hypothetical protein
LASELIFTAEGTTLCHGYRTVAFVVFFFFLKKTGELRFIVLERKKEGPHTNPSSHTGTRYESQGTKLKNISLKENRKHQDLTTRKELGDPSKV